MQNRELEIFLSVAQHLHFGRAAQECNLSPSALTRTVQRLEEQVGAELFVRDNRKVALSDAGRRFQEYARGALLEWQSFQAELKSEQVLAGNLSIYASITAVYSILPDLLEAYQNSYPEVQLELMTGAAEDAVPKVQTGEINLAVAALPDRLRSSFEFLPIITTPLVFIGPRRMGPLDLERAKFVLPQTGLSRRRLDRWFKEQRITPRVSSEVSGNEAIIAMVRLGGGIGVVPRLVLERSPFVDDITILNSAPELAPYVVGLCSTKRNLKNPSVQAFWNLTRDRS